MVSLDVEKAFDSVIWGFLDKVLEKCVFQSNFSQNNRGLLHKADSTDKNKWSFSKNNRTKTKDEAGMWPLTFFIFTLNRTTSTTAQTNWRPKRDSYLRRYTQGSYYADDVLIYLKEPSR